MNTPIGLNFVIASYGYLSSGMATDPSLPLQNADLQVHSTLLAYVRALNVWGRSGKVDVVLQAIKAVWSCARGSGTMRIARLLEGYRLGAALAHGGSARRSRPQSGGCLRWCSQCGGRVAQGSWEEGCRLPCYEESY